MGGAPPRGREAGPHPPHVGGGSPGPAPERHAGKVLGAKRRSSGGVRVDEGGVAVPGLAVPACPGWAWRRGEALGELPGSSGGLIYGKHFAQTSFPTVFRFSTWRLPDHPKRRELKLHTKNADPSARRRAGGSRRRRGGPRDGGHSLGRSLVRHGRQSRVCWRREHVRRGRRLLPDRRGQEGAQRGEYELGGGCPQLQSVAQHTGCALRRPPRSSGPLSPPPNTRARLRRTSPRASICTAARTFRPGSSKAARSTTGAGPARPPRAALAPPQARPARTPPVHWPS